MVIKHKMVEYPNYVSDEKTCLEKALVEIQGPEVAKKTIELLFPKKQYRHEKTKRINNNEYFWKPLPENRTRQENGDYFKRASGGAAINASNTIVVLMPKEAMNFKCDKEKSSEQSKLCNLQCNKDSVNVNICSNCYEKLKYLKDFCQCLTTNEMTSCESSKSKSNKTKEKKTKEKSKKRIKNKKNTNNSRFSEQPVEKAVMNDNETQVCNRDFDSEKQKLASNNEKKINTIYNDKNKSEISNEKNKSANGNEKNKSANGNEKNKSANGNEKNKCANGNDKKRKGDPIKYFYVPNSTTPIPKIYTPRRHNCQWNCHGCYYPACCCMPHLQCGQDCRHCTCCM